MTEPLTPVPQEGNSVPASFAAPFPDRAREDEPVSIATPELLSELNKKYEAPTRESVRQQCADYSESTGRWIESLSDEDFQKLQSKYYFHVTTEDSIRGILDHGLGSQDIFANHSDFNFLATLFQKYGDRDHEWKFTQLVLGGDPTVRRNHARLSADEHKVYAYQIPERIGFLLQNLRYLQTAAYLSADERAQCTEVFGRYITKYTHQAPPVYLLEIPALAPQILENALPSTKDAHDRGIPSEWIIRSFLSGGTSGANINVGFIPPEQIRVADILKFDQRIFEQLLNGKGGLCFP